MNEWKNQIEEQWMNIEELKVNFWLNLRRVPDRCYQIYRTWSEWWCWFYQQIGHPKIPVCTLLMLILAPFSNPINIVSIRERWWRDKPSSSSSSLDRIGVDLVGVIDGHNTERRDRVIAISIYTLYLTSN